ncbi:helix-turn-helix transcriptional regulator [Brachybacterium huguangmaarense]|uniref:Helix-turn-helix transcriptional regulator n=1 Tax=Brachybacterium huguangmaarense TaxID=1652028 RepID=A0ABY6FY09_9MICO|nr:helix-turn-helix transcriptional regulator [Brachybacterium huguangmaarense]UYG15800.1 helix-turn-helix transcriptional regulator [Brachybacterium huguangmaarense]
MRLISYQVLDQYMEFRGETNRSLAKKAGISQATVGHLRSGARNSCRPATARKIAFALQVLPESLFVPEVTTTQAGTTHMERVGPGTAQAASARRGATKAA